jgi:hypothetical protein
MYMSSKKLFEGNMFWKTKKTDGAEDATSYGARGNDSLGLLFVLEGTGPSMENLFVKDARGRQIVKFLQRNIAGRD